MKLRTHFGIRRIATGWTVFLIGVMLLSWLYVTKPLAAGRRQVLADGSVLTVGRVMVAPKFAVVHGTGLEKVLGNLIPTNGLHILNFKLNRRSTMEFDSGGKNWLVVEFKLTGPNITNPLTAFWGVRPLPFRYVIYGEDGMEYEQTLRYMKFQTCSDGSYNYLVTGRFPRDSRWVGIRLEKNDPLIQKMQSQRMPSRVSRWSTVADFKIKNPSLASQEAWIADAIPTIKAVGGLDFILSPVTIKTLSHLTNDVWNVVTKSLQVRSNGIPLTNWVAAYVHTEDASGNSDFLASDGCLDPRCVWKIDVDFEPQPSFSTSQQDDVEMVYPAPPFVTNIAGIPVTFSWTNETLAAELPSALTNISLKLVGLKDENGTHYPTELGNYLQGFRRPTIGLAPRHVYATVTAVPNVHVTFFTHPRLIATDSTRSP